MSTLSNDYDKLRVKQTELFVAQQIYKELQTRNTQDLYINQLPLNNTDNEGFTFRDFHYQQAGLELLVTKKLIQILNPDKLLKIGIHVHIENIKSFKAFYVNLFESVPSAGNCARIIYPTARRATSPSPAFERSRYSQPSRPTPEPGTNGDQSTVFGSRSKCLV